jgi:hypothetical protein
MAKVRQRKSWTHDKFTDDAGVTWNVHKRVVCTGTYCAIHNPSDHPLKDARIVLRMDGFQYGLAERFCGHGTGHSDPDSVAFFDAIGKPGMGSHGCDGCCMVGGFDILNGVEECPPPLSIPEKTNLNVLFSSPMT